MAIPFSEPQAYIPPRSPKFKLGDRVTTIFSGRYTVHEIVRITTERISQSGVMYKIHPALGDNWGDWYDEAWFQKLPFPNP